MLCFNFFFSEIDGGYTPWSEWSSCSDTCGNGVQIRSRSCTAPPQRQGGKDCSRFGAFEEIKTCNVKSCATGIHSGNQVTHENMHMRNERPTLAYSLKI